MNIYIKGNSHKVHEGDFKQALPFNEEAFQSIQDLNSFQKQEREVIFHKKLTSISIDLLL